MSSSFYNLTPDTVLRCIEQSGLSPSGQYMVLNSYENRVYDLTLEDDSHIITKFYRPGRWSLEQIIEEHSFLAELAENDIPVCSPLSFADGRSVHETDGIYYGIWPRTGGRSSDELSDTELEILGRLLARIHNTGAARQNSGRLVLNTENYARLPLAFLASKGFLPDQYIKRYSDAVNEIAGIYDSLSSGVPVHRIHGDCHLGNLLHGPDGWFFLDFDDFLTGPAVQDIWMLVPARDVAGLAQRQVFLEAYRQFREFDESWLRLIEPLRALRYIHYSAWIARRWDDPAFPAAFPHFGTDNYWEEETRNLEDQIDYFYNHTILPEGMNSPAREEAEELTNADFFWDWEE